MSLTSGRTSRLTMPLAPLAVAFAAGIALAPWIAPRAAWALVAAGLAATVLVLVLGQAAHALAPLLAAIAMLGALRATPAPLAADHVGRLPLPATARVEARLAADPIAWAPDRARLALDVESVDGVPRSGRISLGLYGPPPPLADVQDAFRRAGVFHVLAVSGFNVALLAGAVWTLARAAGSGRRTAATGAIVAVLGFAAVVGPEPSVIRATIMAVLVLAAVLLEREASVTNSLALAALAILAARPGDLLDPGFQLSFAATAGIVAAPMPRGTTAAGLGGALAAWRWRARRGPCRTLAAGATLALLTAAALAALPILTRGDGRLRVTVLDVGQGDAIVVETPDGRAVVVDAGAGGPWRLDAGERAVAPFLWNRGVLALHATLTTHADIDHAGGMAALRRLFAVTESWDDAARPRSVGGALLTPIVPDVPDGRRNDRATMLRVEMGLASVLLASDVEAAGERALLEARIPLGATVLKVGHHGAATSSTAPFLAAVRPTVAIVSVGARNLYGHPDAGTLARLGAVGARVYRTDRDGAVLVETDGRTLSVTRWSDRSVERFCLDPETIC